MTSFPPREIPGGWTEQPISSGGRTWNILRPADADAFLEELESQPPGTAEPEIYWARLWETALTMCEFLAHADWPPGSTVLELGCGVGAVGLAALARGWRVTFSDYVPMAVELALANATRNGFDTATGWVLNWKQPMDSQFDVILASDVLYEQQNHAPILNVLDTMLRRGGAAWIGDPGRYHVATFIELARDRGFAVELRGSQGERLGTPTSGRFQLLQLRRRKRE